MAAAKERAYCVLCYGVPVDAVNDANCVRYLRRCLTEALLDPEIPAVLYLVGGPTDPGQPGRTEAEAVAPLVSLLLAEHETHGRPTAHVRVELVEAGIDVIGNVRALRRRLTFLSAPTVFCEYARQDRARAIVRLAFPRARVVPVDFDEAMGHPAWARLRQLPGTALALAAFVSPRFKRFVYDPLRERHMRLDSERRHGVPP